MEKDYTVRLNDEDIAKIAKLNGLKVEDVETADISWTLKLLLAQKISRL